MSKQIQISKQQDLTKVFAAVNKNTGEFWTNGHQIDAIAEAERRNNEYVKLLEEEVKRAKKDLEHALPEDKAGIQSQIDELERSRDNYASSPDWVVLNALEAPKEIYRIDESL